MILNEELLTEAIFKISKTASQLVSISDVTQPKTTAYRNFRFKKFEQTELAAKLLDYFF